MSFADAINRGEEKVMPCKWIKNTYFGEKAKNVLAHAAAGLGYIILKTGKEGTTAAFRVASTQDLSYGAEELDEYESEKMDKVLARRQGLSKKDE